MAASGSDGIGAGPDLRCGNLAITGRVTRDRSTAQLMTRRRKFLTPTHRKNALNPTSAG
jgi:hypothetical protein